MFKKFTLVIITIFSPIICQSCTTILIGKDLTIDGSIIHAHNEDMGATAVGRLWHVDSIIRKKGDLLKVPYVTIPHQENTYGYWASGNAQDTSGLDVSKKSRSYDSVLVGMNQWGVTMSCNWMHSKEKEQKEIGIRRYAIRQLILERATTARQAVQVIGDFIEEHGQADWGGLTYNLADTKEAWVVETTTNHWVAKRIKDNEIWVVANRFRIGEDFDLSSPTLIKNAIDNSWYKPETEGKFNFSKAYGKESFMNQSYDIEREKRVYHLLASKKSKFKAEDIFNVLKDRYEGTNLFTKPQKVENWRETSEKDNIPRTIASTLGQSSFVAVLRSDLPVEVGAMMWYTMVNPQFTGYFPLYAGSTKTASQFQTLSSESNSKSAWWSFKNLHNLASDNYTKAYTLINDFWITNHVTVIEKQKKIEKKALELFSSGNKTEAITLLNNFSTEQSKQTLSNVNRLIEVVENLDN